MKKLVSFKHFVIALAMTFAGLATFSACKDQNFDFDNAHAISSVEKFTDVFIKEFGKPADGHQWGFDMADISMGGDIVSQTRAVYKQDFNVPSVNKHIKDYMPLPNDITKREHDEVFAWFKYHKVFWSNTPTYYGYQQTTISKDYNTRQTVNNTNIAYIDNRSVALPDGYDSVLKLKESSEEKYIKFLRDDLGFGSLVKYDVNYLGNAPMGTKISFTNAWVQHVAHDTEKDEIAADNANSYNCSNMDNVQYWDYNETIYANSKDHSLDWNNGQGYGYDESKNDGSPTVHNGTLVTGADVNCWTYGCSAGSSSQHDKFYIVYLKGDGYEGYYMGLDFESYKENANNNEIVKANGYCNDWIIKIVNLAEVSDYNPARIMCEDLGGNFGVSATDIDYNDIVLDVDYKNNVNNSCVVTLTLQAAGGTLPLCVFYDKDTGTGITEERLFEVHELFYDVYDGHATRDQYQTMINTKGPKSVSELSSSAKTADLDAKTFKLFINTTEGYTRANNEKCITDSEKFAFGKIKIKVFRLGVDDYLTTSPGSIDIAEWVDLANYEGEAPLKICVPKYYKGIETQWLQERVKITDGYKNFVDWVKDPVKKFWDRSLFKVITDCLYGSGSTAPETETPQKQDTDGSAKPFEFINDNGNSGILMNNFNGPATISIVDGVYELANTERRDNNYEAQVAYDSYYNNFVEGKSYTFSCKIKGSSEGSMFVGLQVPSGTYPVRGSWNVDFNTEWQDYSGTITCSGGSDAKRLIMQFGHFVGTIYMDDIKLVQNN